MAAQEPDQSGRAAARRRFARLMHRLVVRAPWAWPLVRGGMRRQFDRYAADWDSRVDAGSPEHLAPLAAALLHVHPAPERALDVGTGTGEAALLVAREFPAARVRGVDISAEMIAQARAKVGLDPEGRIAFKVADSAALPWPDGSFDLLTMLNAPPFFAEVARVLRPGGFAVVAASWGPRTPFHTPDELLRRGFERHGVRELASGEAAQGTYWIGRAAA